jgi:glycosyltransferase involved in cell wall biosynthesis
MKICYVTGGETVPSVRLRLPFFEQLKQRGDHVTLMHSMPSRYEHYRLIGWRLSQRLRLLLRSIDLLRIRAGRFDVVVLETGFLHTSDWHLEAALRKVARRLVYDVDDAIFLLFPEKFAYITAAADHVIAGNAAIARQVRQHNRSISIIPTCVDADEYRPRSPAIQDTTGEGPVVGWIGSAGNVRMLQVCAKALTRANAKIPFAVHIITAAGSRAHDLHIEGLQLTWIDIDRCDIQQELSRLDIGLMPLPSGDPWMEYKCNAKMVQYMAMGIPAVASAIGFNLELVDHGVNSLLASTDEEWEAGLLRLLSSPFLRRQLGEQARKTALQRFTVQARLSDFERALTGEVQA